MKENEEWGGGGGGGGTEHLGARLDCENTLDAALRPSHGRAA